MTADVRGYVYCNLGEVISGSFQHSSMVGAGVMTVDGSVVLKGKRGASEGTALRLSYYNPIKRTLRSLGPGFIVISSVYNPTDNTTEVLFACALGFKAEYEAPKKILNNVDETGQIDKEEMTEVQRLSLIVPLSLNQIVDECNFELGLGGSIPGAAGVQLYREDFAISDNLMSTLNDIAISLNQCMYARGKSAYSTFSLDNPSGASYLIPKQDIISLRPSGSPVRAATNVYASWDSLTLDTVLEETTNPEPDPTKEELPPDAAYCLESYERTEGEPYLYEWTYYNEGLGEYVDKTYTEDINNDVYDRTCYDDEGREVYYLNKSNGLFGETKTERYTSYSVMFIPELKAVDGRLYDSMSQGEKDLLISIQRSIQQFIAKKIAEAREEIRDLEKENPTQAQAELALFTANPYQYTLGFPTVEAYMDSLGDDFKIKRTYTKEYTYEPRALYLSGAGLPDLAYYDLDSESRPLYAPLFRRWARGTYLRQKTEIFTYETPYASHTVTKAYGAPYLTQSGTQEINSWLKGQHIDEENAEISWEEVCEENGGLALTYLIPGILNRALGSQYAYEAAVRLIETNITHNKKKFDVNRVISNLEFDVDANQAEIEKIPTFAYTTGGNTKLKSISGGFSAGIKFVYSPPFAPDDSIYKAGETFNGPIYLIRRGNAESFAEKYAEVQNRLRLAKANSVSVVLPIKYYEFRPVSYTLQLGNIQSYGTFVTDSVQVAFDSDGILMSADLLYRGAIT